MNTDALAPLSTLTERLTFFYTALGLAMLALSIAATAVTAWIVWLFYRCHRERNEELRKIRLSLEATPTKDQPRRYWMPEGMK